MKIKRAQNSHEGTRGCGGIAPFILDLGKRWRFVFNFTSRLLYPRANEPQYALNKKLGGIRNRSERYGEEIKLDLTNQTSSL